MTQDNLERMFKRLKSQTFYYGDIELVRYFMFELDRVKEDLLRVDYELRFCSNSVDNSTQYWKNLRNY